MHGLNRAGLKTPHRARHNLKGISDHGCFPNENGCFCFLKERVNEKESESECEKEQSENFLKCECGVREGTE
jgi:hypothetical protein